MWGVGAGWCDGDGIFYASMLMRIGTTALVLLFVRRDLMRRLRRHILRWGWPDSLHMRRNKSLLLLFFRKEESLACWCDGVSIVACSARLDASPAATHPTMEGMARLVARAETQKSFASFLQKRRVFGVVV
jgi:hypothetical protein